MINGTKDRPKAFNIGCAAHSLNLSIGDAMKNGVDKPFEKMVAASRRLVGHFKMSTLATNGLRAKVKEMLASEHHGKGLYMSFPIHEGSALHKNKLITE